MPRTKSTAKAARQSEDRRKRLTPYKTRMKTMIRKISDAAKTNKADAAKMLPEVYKAIDTAAKKRIIEKKTADRRKSLVARMVAA